MIYKVYQYLIQISNVRILINSMNMRYLEVLHDHVICPLVPVAVIASPHLDFARDHGMAESREKDRDSFCTYDHNAAEKRQKAANGKNCQFLQR